jgi:iron(III) transport system substrate-binding protein
MASEFDSPLMSTSLRLTLPLPLISDCDDAGSEHVSATKARSRPINLMSFVSVFRKNPLTRLRWGCAIDLVPRRPRLKSSSLILTLVIPWFAQAAPPTIRVLTDRTESNLKPIFDIYEKAKGVKISVVYLDQGLIERLQSRPEEADLVITKDAELLEIARQRQLLQPFQSEAIKKNIPAQFREPNGNYFIDAYRGRVILYSKARVRANQLSTYEDLADPKWKGKLCIRSGYHDYNVSLFSQMATAFGIDRAKRVMRGFHDNLAREPKGSDRDQAKGIFENQCDVAIMNTYYYVLMKESPEQKPWADATEVFFPDQESGGTFIMRSALGLTKAKANVRPATELLEYIGSVEGQSLTARLTYQFTTNKDVPMNEALRHMGAGQPSVKGGRFKMNFVPLAQMAESREAVVKYLNEIGFDKH